MLSWTVVLEESNADKLIRRHSTLSSFAVIKNDHRDRLISWPKLQNAVGPDPPNPALPTPDAWARVNVSASNLKAFHFDVRDMFHHLPLPPRLSHLFPLRQVYFGELPAQLQTALSNIFGTKLQPDTLLRPFHATVPMGWAWAVTIANNVSSRLLIHTYTLFRTPSYARTLHKLDGQLRSVQAADALLDAYIDDILGVCADWSDSDIINLYRFTASTFEKHGLPCHPTKSLPLNEVRKNYVSFTGWIWHFRESLVFPDQDKIRDLEQDIAKKD